MKGFSYRWYGYIFLELIIFLALFNAPGTRKRGKDLSAPRVYTVEISGMKFNPAALVVHQGDKVMFVNHDLVVHDVTEAAKKSWTSSPLGVGKSWSLNVQQSAVYYCSIHPVMRGSITVK
ncbi:MAG: hypothetical protein JWP57_1879 [Spirosoma sp.]|nr:hypothetical protein [Spirosoma sp.]